MKKKALWASFFSCVCARLFPGWRYQSGCRRGAKEEGLYLQLHSTHRNQNGESIFVCVDPFSSSPRFFQILFPSVTNKIEPSTTGRVSVLLWRYRLILIPLFPSTLLLSHSVCVCVMCLSSLFAMALTVKPHWKGDAAWWGSLVSGEGKNERSPPTPPALRLKKKHLIFFANEPANNDFYIVFKWPIVFGLRKCRESRKNAATPPRVCRLLALPLLRAGQTLEMQITSV